MLNGTDLSRRGRKRKKSCLFPAAAGLFLAAVLMAGGCAGGTNEPEQLVQDGKSPEQAGEEAAGVETDRNTEEAADAGEVLNADADTGPEEVPVQEASGPEMVEEDWSAYFDGLNGCAVLYEPSKRRYRVYEQELAETQRSPCSTFKIVSSLIALESGVILPERSVRTWSGETFWNEDWNHDQTFEEAFHASCVWYFREVIDEIGPERMQAELDRLEYGNCDVSDWEGRLNTNNNNRSLTGFWIESSLAISPKEQTEVMERIFGNGSVYSEEARSELRQVMLTEQSDPEVVIYGKTGMGKAHGIVVDAWFTGFAEKNGETIYFCIYLGRTDGRNVSSAAAREIAISILSETTII